jgi:excinuclease UvrABC ATPase subunit
MSERQFIEVYGANENNLKDISLKIPKQKITVFTGVSGSGKSSLVFDTIAAEAQRQINETFTAFVQGFLPHYGQPQVDHIENLNAPIIVDQKRVGGGSRSTVGTYTDIASLLRLLFSRVGKPYVGLAFAFSFNTPQGMCPECEGIGKTVQLDLNKFLDRSKSLNDGAILEATLPDQTERAATNRSYYHPERQLAQPEKCNSQSSHRRIDGGDRCRRVG